MAGYDIYEDQIICKDLGNPPILIYCTIINKLIFIQAIQLCMLSQQPLQMFNLITLVS